MLPVRNPVPVNEGEPHQASKADAEGGEGRMAGEVVMAGTAPRRNKSVMLKETSSVWTGYCHQTSIDVLVIISGKGHPEL